ncbi:heterokaryon incompatibility protein-domain-containing protein [Xylariomycetidae sp. FL2044]|nr:heterokaryon incompatibility protein-domain-containing protein [Xylariomycetidae sp. FL2044]
MESEMTDHGPSGVLRWVPRPMRIVFAIILVIPIFTLLLLMLPAYVLSYSLGRVIGPRGREYIRHLLSLTPLGVWYYRLRRFTRVLDLNLKYGWPKHAIYRPLNKSRREIRVLQIAPGQGKARLICELQHLQLDASPIYEALSYTWGPAHLLASITVDGTPMHVTTGLRDALESLRLPDAMRTIWVDSLCINQQDLKERGEQVSMMRHIYSKASQVVIWLGKDTSTTAYAVELLSEAAQKEYPRDWLLQTLKDQSNRSRWSAVLALFSRNYFNRVWIIQEISMASRLIVRCGSSSISWGTLYECQQAWSQAENRPDMRPFTELYPEREANLRIVMLHVSRGMRMEDRLSSLLHLLEMHRDALATDPRDRTFALLGLSADCQEMKADYALPPFETFLQTLQYLTQEVGDLDFLISAVGDRHSGWRAFKSLAIPTSYPSWLPYFYWKLSPSKRTLVTRSHDRTLFTCTGRSFNASGDHQAKASLSMSLARGWIGSVGKCRGTLTAEGVIIGTIQTRLLRFAEKDSHVDNVTNLLNEDEKRKHARPTPSWLPKDGHHGSFLSGPSFEKRIVATWIKVLQEIFNYAVTVPPYDRQNRDVVAGELWRTLVYNRTANIGKAPDEWCSLFKVILDGPEHIPSDYTPFDGEDNPLGPAERAFMYIEPFIQSFRAFGITGHELVITDRGFCMASESREGQKVCIIFGCSVPLIVRPASENMFGGAEPGALKIVAPAYIHQFMYGQIEGFLKEGTLAPQSFTIV